MKKNSSSPGKVNTATSQKKGESGGKKKQEGTKSPANAMSHL